MGSYVLAVAYMILALLAAHLAAPGEYVWYRHTLSQLAAQGYPSAWIMRAGLLGFGALVILAGALRVRRCPRRWWREAGLLVYGTAILGSGLFCAAPFIEGTPYSEVEARLHSVLATSAGVALSAAMALHALTDQTRGGRAIHVGGLAAVLALSMLFGAWPAMGGAIQRLLWLAGFVWLVVLGRGTAAPRVRTVSGAKP